MEKEESKVKDESKRKREAESSGKRPSKMPCLTEAKIEAPTPPSPSPPTPSPTNINDGPFHSIRHTPRPHTITLTMPDESSMIHVLRCALDAAIYEMAKDENAPPGYYSHLAAKIEGQLDSYEKKS